jgi:hypothetical protein
MSDSESSEHHSLTKSLETPPKKTSLLGEIREKRLALEKQKKERKTVSDAGAVSACPLGELSATRELLSACPLGRAAQEGGEARKERSSKARKEGGRETSKEGR